MSDESKEESDFPSPDGMRGWLKREIADIMKASELRMKDAVDFVSRYAAGDITADEAANLSYKYQERWGDALPGVLRSEGMSDEAILARIDDAQNPHFVARLSEARSAGVKAKE